MKFNKNIEETEIRIEPTLVINNIEVRYYYDKEGIYRYRVYDFFCSLYGGESIEEWNKVDEYLCSCAKFCKFYECRYPGDWMTTQELIELFQEIFPYKVQDVTLVLNRIESLKEFLKPNNKATLNEFRV